MRVDSNEIFGILLADGAFLDASGVKALRDAGRVLIVGAHAADAAVALGDGVDALPVEAAANLDKALKSAEAECFDAALLIGALAPLEARAQKKLLDTVRNGLSPGGRLYLLEPNAAVANVRESNLPEKARPLTHHALAERLAESGFAIAELSARCGAAAPGAMFGHAFARVRAVSALTGAWLDARAVVSEDSAAAANLDQANRATSTVRHFKVLACILLLAFLSRMPGLDDPPLGTLFWRQTQTLMVARNYARESMNIFRPEVNFRRIDEPTERGYVGGTELQVVPWLSALLYRLFGESFWAGRLPSILFSILGIAYFHRLAARWRNETCASLAALFLAVSPQYWILGRAHMPEAFVFCTSFAAVYYYDRWLRTSTHGAFSSAVVASALTLLGKPQFGVIALPLAAATFVRRGWKCMLDTRLYLFAVLPAIPTIAYLWYSYRVITAETGLSFAQPDLLRLGLVFDPEYHALVWGRVFSDSVGPIMSLAALAGLVMVPRRRASIEWTAYAWALSVVAFFLIMPGGNRANFYYQSMAIAPACFFAARAVCALGALSRWRVPAIALSAAIVIQSLALAAPELRAPNGTQALACGRWLDENLPLNATVLTLTGDPGALYFADRIGWICWRQNNGDPIERTVATVEKARTHGALAAAGVGEYALDNGQDHDRARLLPLSDHLNERYYCVRTADFVVYHLQRPADLTVPPEGIQFGTPESRKYLRGAWGPNQRTRLLEPFTTLVPDSRAQLRIDLPPGGPRRLSLVVAPSQVGQEITARLDGREVSKRHYSQPWVKQTIDLGEVPDGEEGRHTIDIEVSPAKDIGLLLYALALKQ